MLIFFGEIAPIALVLFERIQYNWEGYLCHVFMACLGREDNEFWGYRVAKAERYLMG